jgi:hypothetical protein
MLFCAEDKVKKNSLLLAITYSVEAQVSSLSRRKDSKKNKLFAYLCARTSLIGPRVM